MNITYLSSIDELVEKGAALVAKSMKEAVSDRDQAMLVLSGGNTPRPVYERLAREPFGNTLPWDKTQIFFGDERMVPPDNPESNFRMACDALLDHIEIPPWNIHRIEGQDQPDVAAHWYDRQLREIGGPDAVPRFDLILLGLGPDGHTASLFPGTNVLEDRTHLAAPVHLPDDSQGVQHSQNRVTLTYPVINAARKIVFLVAGADKKQALDRVERGDETAPAARVKPVDGELLWLVVKS